MVRTLDPERTRPDSRPEQQRRATDIEQGAFVQDIDRAARRAGDRAGLTVVAGIEITTNHPRDKAPQRDLGAATARHAALPERGRPAFLIARAETQARARGVARPGAPTDRA